LGWSFSTRSHDLYGHLNAENQGNAVGVRQCCPGRQPPIQNRSTAKKLANRNHSGYSPGHLIMERAFITGAAGFIGSNLVDRLLGDSKMVIGWDDFSTGQPEFLQSAQANPKFKLIEGDCLDLPALTRAKAGCDFVFHLAANADVRFGLDHPHKDFQQNAAATFNVLEAMRANGIKGIAFSSTGSVYGEAETIPTPENASFPVQTSLYAASKLAGEGFIHAYCEGYGFESYVFRFVSILGERYTHGHVLDFYKQLITHPDHLKILGDGTQRKSYLYIGDCLAAMLHVIAQATAKKAKHRVETYNLGTDEYVQVNDSVRLICNSLGLKPRLEFSGGNKGWVGDNPFIFLDTKKIRATGWKTTLTIEQSIVRTLQWLQQNQWVLQRR
jgi:UDP-glucose 4-epimerase